MIRGLVLALPLLIAFALPAQASFFGRVFGSPPAIIEEVDGDPSLSGRKIVFPSGSLTDQGGGVVSVAVPSVQDVTDLSVSTSANKAEIDSNTVRLSEVSIDTAAHAADGGAHAADASNTNDAIVRRDANGSIEVSTVNAQGYSSSGVSGINKLCASGEFLDEQEVAGGITVAGNCIPETGGAVEFTQARSTTTNNIPQFNTTATLLQDCIPGSTVQLNIQVGISSVVAIIQGSAQNNTVNANKLGIIVDGQYPVGRSTTSGIIKNLNSTVNGASSFNVVFVIPSLTAGLHDFCLQAAADAGTMTWTGALSGGANQFTIWEMQ